MTPSLGERLHELRRQWKGAAQRNPRALAAAVAIFSLQAVVSVCGSVWFLTDLRNGMPEESAVTRIGEMDRATHLYDASDKLAFTIFKEQRTAVPIDEVSPNLVRALIAVEDQHFYDHHGFDAGRIALAALADIRHRRAAQGASTLTQQLARQSFLTRDKTIRRKVQELILAAKIERLYSKPEILELYLNKVYFGDGLYGVEAASRGYFGKHASALSVAEAALLAGLVKSPSSYAPTTNMERAKWRRNVVLQAMLESGAIDRATWQAARASKVILTDGLPAQEPHGQYFKEQVRRELVDRFGWQQVYQGGLRVYTTIDMDAQIAAETSVDESLKAIDARRKALLAQRPPPNGGKTPGAPAPSDADHPLQAALVAMDPATGHVRAMVGGRDFDRSRYNRAVQAKRQPGSAFKPFVYAAALEAGFTPATVISNLNDPIATGQGNWTPDDHSTADAMTLRTGLRTSSNRAAVQLMRQVGIPRTVEYARTMGVGDLPNVPSLALGSGEVTLQSLTAAYAAFANHGLVPRPVLIRRVEDCEGHVLYETHSTPIRAISDTTAFLMTSMMADVINAGTGARARQLGFKLPAAGKTGTTNDFKDAWFIGFTPTLVTGVWVGFDQARTILPRGFASDIAVPLWASFMKAATLHDKPDWFTPPPGVTSATICRISGKLAADGCHSVEVVNKDGVLETRSMVYTEYFASGTDPIGICDMHLVPSVYGRIAGALGGTDEPAAPRVWGLPPAAVGATGTFGAQPATGATGSTGTGGTAGATGSVGTTGTMEVPPRVEDPGRKRGFWSRILGGKGRNEPEKPEDPGQPPPKKKGA